MEDEIIDKSPIKKSHIPQRRFNEEKKIIVDAVDKYKKVHAAIHEIFKDNAHHRAFFLFGFYGRRLNEVATLSWDDINFKDGIYRVKREHSKVAQDMTFALPDDVKEALMEFADVSGPVFHVREVKRHYSKIREKTGIHEFTFHWMRNLAVSALSAMGVETTHLSAMLGHTDPGTLRKYLSLQRAESTTRTNEAAKALLINHKESN